MSESAALDAVFRADFQGDWEARGRALNPDRSFIVEAPAGSGKTELLIQRYLLLLARVEKPESVLAVTFTRKAAAEMRARVLRALERAAGAEPESGHEQTTYRLASAVRKQDVSRGWNLIDNPSRLAIQTIDALAASIVGRMPWVSRLGPLPSPDDAVDDLYARAAIRTLEAVHSAPGEVADAVSRLIEHLDNDIGSVAGLLSSMLGSRDQWLRHVTTGALASARFREELDDTLHRIVSGGLASLGGAYPEHLRSETAALARRAGERIGPDSLLSCLRGLEDLPGCEDVDQWRALAQLFLRGDGKRRQRLTIREGFGREDTRDKQRFSNLDPGDEFLEQLRAVHALPPRAVHRDQWEVLSALGVLLPRAVEELRALFEESGRVDFIEIGLAAREALGSPTAPTSLAFAMDCRLEHILVDEFQDTSESQYELLARLTGEWDSIDGRTLFLVGDPMQSIYRFRKADVALFLRAQRDGFGAIELEPLTLRVNFRSTQNVVEWINRAVGPAFPVSPDPLTGAVTYTASTAPGGDGPVESAVTLHPILSRNDEREAEIVHGIVRSVLEGDAESTVAVLVRSRSHAGRITAMLRSEGIRFQAVEMNPLGTLPVVRDLYMLTRALLHLADRISWLAILRAPWCGLTLDDLFRLTRRSDGRTVLSLIAEGNWTTSLDPDGRKRLGRVAPVLLEALEKRGTLPLRRWVEGVWLELGGPAGLEDRNASGDAEIYLDLLERFDEGGEIRDWSRFDRAVSDLFARPDTGAAINSRGEARVQVLMIHKAKGLEFDCVILPGLGRTTASDRARLVEWLEFVDSTGRPRLVAAPVRAPGSARDPLLGFVTGVQKQRLDNEETRLLYVAATRARQSLHLIGHVEVDRSGKTVAPHPRSALSRLWKCVDEEFMALRPDTGPVRQAEIARPLNRLTRLPSGWVRPDPEMTPFPIAGEAGSSPPVLDRPSFNWAGDLQRRVGLVVHRMLERLARGRFDLARLPIRAALAAEGLSGRRLAEAVLLVETALARTVADPRGRWILGERDDSDSELALSGQVGGVVRRIVIDRTFVEDPIRWIIDFKSGVHEGAGREQFLDNEVDRYRAQMELYARVVRGMDSRPIRIGLYYPMFGGWREWSPGECSTGDGPETLEGAVTVRG